jgi:hypothetical protein
MTFAIKAATKVAGISAGTVVFLGGFFWLGGSS